MKEETAETAVSLYREVSAPGGPSLGPRRPIVTASAQTGPKVGALSYGGGPRATNRPMTADHGDPAGPDELRRELVLHHRAAFAWANNCCRRDRSEAEEVLQVSYLKVLDGRARFDGRASFRTWLFGVIHRTAADQRRRRAVRDLLALRWGVEEAAREPVPPAWAAVEAVQQSALLLRALAALPRRQREVLLLVFFHELTVEDAAGVMSIGLGSARQHYARGKARLRRLLGATGRA